MRWYFKGKKGKKLLKKVNGTIIIRSLALLRRRRGMKFLKGVKSEINKWLFLE